MVAALPTSGGIQHDPSGPKETGPTEIEGGDLIAQGFAAKGNDVVKASIADDFELICLQSCEVNLNALDNASFRLAGSSRRLTGRIARTPTTMKTRIATGVGSNCIYSATLLQAVWQCAMVPGALSLHHAVVAQAGPYEGSEA